MLIDLIRANNMLKNTYKKILKEGDDFDFYSCITNFLEEISPINNDNNEEESE